MKLHRFCTAIVVLVLIVQSLFVFAQAGGKGKQAKGQTSGYDYSKILRGNFADFAGTWINGRGERQQLNANGTFARGQRAVNTRLGTTTSGPAGAYIWGVEVSAGGGFAAALFPAGVEVPGVRTDATKVRLFTGQDSPSSGDQIFYLESEGGPPALAERDYTGTWFIIVKYGPALSISPRSSANGAPVVIVNGYGVRDRHSQWVLDQQADGSYIITNVNSGKAIDVPNFSQNIGEGLLQWDRNGGPNQRWRVVRVGEDFVMFVSVNSGKVIDVPNFANENNTQVVQWDSNGGDNQQFRLVPVR